MERTTDALAPPRPRTTVHAGAATVLMLATLTLAAAAFLLLPTGQANTSRVVTVNGTLYSVASAATLQQVAGNFLALARPGSELDMTGDVSGFGRGAPSEITIQGAPVDGAAALPDGASLVVRHGSSHLEAIAMKEQALPFKTVYEGKGAVVSLAQPGTPGKKEIFRGTESGKQAAEFTVAAPKDEIVRRSGGAKAGQKLVALTFDDGPSKYTQGVLDALAAKHVPATFFVLGGNASSHLDLIAKERAAGQEVENHTWSHADLTKLSSDAIKKEISRTDAVIGGSHYVRPPYGSYNTTVTEAAAALGHRLVLWTVDTLDWQNRNADKILANVKAETRPGAIILMHDGGDDRSATVAAIPRVVDWLLANGYSLTTVSNLLKE